MGYKDNCKGTTESEFSIGAAGAGPRVLSIFNDFLAKFIWNPTANRNINVPDASGTLVLQNGGKISNITPGAAAGEVATYDQIGSSPLFGTTLTNGTTLSVTTHGNKRLPVNGGTINLPSDASWPIDVVFEFFSVGTTPTVINWTGNTITSQDTGALVSQIIGGAISAAAVVVKTGAGTANIYSGTARGIDAVSITLGTNPNTPAVGLTANYNFVSAAGLIIQGIYQFSDITGTFKVTAITENTVTLENLSATVGTAVPTATKLAPAGIKGDAGVGTNGTNATAITSGTNPNTPAVGSTADYTMISTAGLISLGTYQFAGVAGTFTLTNISTNAITLQNVNATVGASVPTGTRLAPAGIPGAAGPAGVSTIATVTGSPPVTPGIGLTATYSLDNVSGIGVQRYYGFDNLAGAFLVTAISGLNVTLQNITAAVGATITAGTKIFPTGRPALDYTPLPIRSGLDLTIAISAGIGTASATANSLRAWHWEVKKTISLVALRQEVSTLVAATTFRLALYADNGSLYPGALIANSDTGAFDSSVTGVKSGTFASSIVLTPGSYWLAFNSNGTPSLRTIPVSSLSNVLGGIATGGTNGTATCWVIAQAFAALPATFPTGATLTGNVPAPYTMFRLS